MIEDAQKILNYLPREYKTDQEQEYINFLWDSFQSNYEHDKYQFAFIAYHMLFMSFVYFSIWKIKTQKEHDFSKALIGFNKDIETSLLTATSPFAFSEIREKSIFRFFKLLGCNNAQIGELSKIVDDRNDIAHSNGNVFYKTQSQLDDKIQEILRCSEQIQHCLEYIGVETFKNFMTESRDPENREYQIDEEQFREILLKRNYFSRKDTDLCLAFDISSLSSHIDYPLINNIFQKFITIYNED